MLRFLERFPTPAKAAWLSERRLAVWLQANAYCGRRAPAELLARLRTAPPGLQGPWADAQALVTLSLVRLLRTLVAEIAKLEAHIHEQLALHPDGPSSRACRGAARSAPPLCWLRSATAARASPRRRPWRPWPVRCPRRAPLASIGRSPSAGACDKKLRAALVDFAQDSVRASPRADQLYRRHRQQRKAHAHAARILTRAWIGVIWRCWQDRQPYDPTHHRALQRLLARGG